MTHVGQGVTEEKNVEGIIKVSTNLEVSTHTFPEGTLEEQRRQLCALIGNGCTMLEMVRPRRLYGNSVGELGCTLEVLEKGKSKAVSLLLYKDARVDQNILDEIVGEMNWQKSYSRENANCTVSIWDEAKKMWISKEDTGTEKIGRAHV